MSSSPRTAGAQSPSPDDPNRTVWQYLAAYCQAERSPGYAVLVTGPWGTGKTYFIKHLLEQIGQESLFITLNGVTGPADIEAQIFRQLHPVLSSKGMRLAGIVAKGLLKGTLKIDLNGDASDDGSVSPTIPDLKLKDIAKSANGRVMVFDDLERSSMKIHEVLGYINAFVEHEGIRAIVIANDKELGEEGGEFKRIKEKLIGQTLEIKPHVDSAFPELIATLSDIWTKQFLHRHKAEVLEVFRMSTTANLRALRQALQDVERYARLLRPADKAHEEALLAIAQELIALSLDYRTGALSAEDVSKAHLRHAGSVRRRSEGDPKGFELTESRYQDLDLRSPWLSSAVLNALFVQGWVDAETVQSALDQAPPFIPKSQEPAWRRAWAGYERSDADFEAAMAQVEAEYAAKAFTLPGEILHVFGLRLQAARIGLIGLSKAKVVAESKLYLNELVKSGLLETLPGDVDGHQMHHGYGGLAFQERESDEFAVLRQALKEAMNRMAEARRPSEAQTLLETMQSDAREFERLIQITNRGPAPYWDTPILQHIAAKTFVSDLLNLPPPAQHTVLLALKGRYSTGEAKPKLRVERPWLVEVRGILRKALPTLRPMSRHRLTSLLGSVIEPAIAELSPQPPSSSIPKEGKASRVAERAGPAPSPKKRPRNRVS